MSRPPIRTCQVQPSSTPDSKDPILGSQQRARRAGCTGRAGIYGISYDDSSVLLAAGQQPHTTDSGCIQLGTGLFRKLVSGWMGLLYGC